MSESIANIHYKIKVASISGHYFDVELHIDKPKPDGQKLTLPAWIPGSYMVRDFAKNIIAIEAKTSDDSPIAIHKLDKQTWQLGRTDGKVIVCYRVYAFDLSIRSAYINDQFAFFNGTSLCLSVQGQEDNEHSIAFIKPDIKGCETWQVATSLNTYTGTKHHAFGHYFAENYADLIDHPVLIGEYDIVPFATGDIEFELILAGGHQSDTTRMAADLTNICQHHIDMFGSKPDIDRYLFITLLNSDGYGGLEHMSSTALLFSRDDLPSIQQSGKMTEGYRNFLALCSHEFFHTWHVKRIKPQVLAEATLATETYTEQLWIYEGFTSYYDDYALRRCGLLTSEEYLEVVGQNLTRLLRNKGRLKQCVTESSFDAWTKFYKQGPDAINNIVSYYVKGGIIAMSLDLVIRQQTNHKKCLDDVMRSLWQRHGRTGIGTDDKVIHRIVKQELELDLDTWLDKYLYTTEDLPVETLLNEVGIQLHSRSQTGPKDLGGKPQTDCPNIEFGARFSAANLGVKVQAVVEDSAAYDAGLQIGDQLIAIAGWQLSQADLQSKLEAHVKQDPIPLTVLRDKRLLQLGLPVRQASLNTFYLTIEEQTKAADWLFIG